MATITKTDNPYLITMLGVRIRPRAEQCMAWIVRAPEVVRRMETALALESIPDIIDDGIIGQAPFTSAHYQAFLALFQSIVQMGQNGQVMAALGSMVVRDMVSLTPPLPDIQPGLGPIASILKYVIRPLAPGLRALYALVGDDSPIIPDTLGSYADDDIIDDGRAAEMVRPVPVGAVRLMVQLLGQMSGSGDETIARACDAACTSPLMAS
jgi:hypothetical protein